MGLSKQIFIPFNVPSSKNGRSVFNGNLVTSASIKDWRRNTLPFWLKNRPMFLAMIKDLPKPYFIHLTFIRGTRHKFDYINAAQVIKDMMKKPVNRVPKKTGKPKKGYGMDYIDDDNADEVVTVFGKYSYNKENPGVIIRVLSKPPQYEFV